MNTEPTGFSWMYGDLPWSASPSPATSHCTSCFGNPTLATEDRPDLLRALDYIREGDLLTVHEVAAGSAATSWRA